MSADSSPQSCAASAACELLRLYGGGSGACFVLLFLAFGRRQQPPVGVVALLPRDDMALY